MSANAEDEAKARLEVAQLYEEMGQGAKAVRYLLAAAEIYRDRGDQGRMREVYQRVLAIEPNNAQAVKDLGAAQAAAIEAQGRPSAAPAASAAPAQHTASTTHQAAAPAAPAAPVQPRKNVLVPTPWVGRDPKFLAAVRAQITTPPDKMLFPFSPLPRVDDRALAAKAEARRVAAEAEARKNQTATPSSFNSQESRFAVGGAATGAGSGGGFKAPATAASAGAAVPQQPAAQAPPVSRFAPAGDIKGGNRDLAEMIRKRMEGKGG